MGFKTNENLIIEVDITRLPKAEQDDTLLAEKAGLVAVNKGCDPVSATKMGKECVKADGNCLFNCATLALEGTVDKPQEMREIIASVMLSDPLTYSKEELGKDPNDYAAWITGSSSAWGGIPELKALSQFYECEFGVVVISDLEVLVFGKDRGYNKRVYVLYDGTHYNLISQSKLQRSFSPTNEQAYQGALELAKICKKKGEAIDVSVFSLVCFDCQTPLVG